MGKRKSLIESHTKKVEEEMEQKLANLQVLQKKIKYYETMDKRKQRLSERAFNQLNENNDRIRKD